MYVARNLWLTSSAQELETFPMLVFKREYSERSAAAGDDEPEVERNLLKRKRLYGRAASRGIQCGGCGRIRSGKQ